MFILNKNLLFHNNDKLLEKKNNQINNRISYSLADDQLHKFLSFSGGPFLLKIGFVTLSKGRIYRLTHYI